MVDPGAQAPGPLSVGAHLRQRPRREVIHTNTQPTPSQRSVSAQLAPSQRPVVSARAKGLCPIQTKCVRSQTLDMPKNVTRESSPRTSGITQSLDKSAEITVTSRTQFGPRLSESVSDFGRFFAIYPTYMGG